MSCNATVSRFLPVLFLLCAGITSSTALAQNAGSGGDAVADESKIMLVGCDGGGAMISVDGGNVWRILDATAAEAARRDLKSLSSLRRITAARTSSSSALAMPNPTSGRTEIRYSIAEAEGVTITLHSTTGEEVLRNTALPLHPGAQITTIDASGVASGGYFFRVRSASGRVVAEGSLAIAR